MSPPVSNRLLLPQSDLRSVLHWLQQEIHGNREDYCEMSRRIVAQVIISLEWVSRGNAAVHINAFSVSPQSPVYARCDVGF